MLDDMSLQKRILIDFILILIACISIFTWCLYDMNQPREAKYVENSECIGPYDEVWTPLVMVEGRVYKCANVIQYLPLHEDLALYGDLISTKEKRPKANCEFSSAYTAKGQLFYYPNNPAIVYARLLSRDEQQTFIYRFYQLEDDNEANLIHKTYMGEITEIGEDYLVIDCSTTNSDEKFLLNERTLEINFDLMVGQNVLVECEFYTNDEKTYTAIMIALD